MAAPLRVLIVDDSEDDALLLARELRRGGYEPTFARVDTAEAMATALDSQPWDAVICDYAMPQFNAPAALALLQEKGLDLPFILVSGFVGEETGVMVMNAGAHDFVLKDRPSRLLPAVERELREARHRAEGRKAEEAIGKYMSPKIYGLIQHTELKMGGHSREITVLKTDIRDFTTRSESMEPEPLIEFLNRYFTRMVAVVHKYEGEVDKFMGDAVLAKFGATEWYPDHARRAVLTMIEMIEACEAFNEELKKEDEPPVRMGIGCSTGPAVVGNVGSPERMEYTVVSSTVNSAQRIEEVSRDLGWDLLISDTTFQQAKEWIEVGEPVVTKLRGQTRETCIYPVLGRRDEISPERRRAYEAFRARLDGLPSGT